MAYSSRRKIISDFTYFRGHPILRASFSEQRTRIWTVTVITQLTDPAHLSLLKPVCRNDNGGQHLSCGTALFIDTDDLPVPGRITATGMQYVYCFSRTLSSWLLSRIFSHFYFFCC